MSIFDELALANTANTCRSWVQETQEIRRCWWGTELHPLSGPNILRGYLCCVLTTQKEISININSIIIRLTNIIFTYFQAQLISHPLPDLGKGWSLHWVKILPNLRDSPPQNHRFEQYRSVIHVNKPLIIVAIVEDWE